MDTIYYHDIKRYKYRLAREYHVQIPLYGRAGGTFLLEIDAKGWLWFDKGYCWDGPSGPTIDTPGSLRASLIHDGMYALLKLGVLQPEAKALADVILRDTYIEDAMRVLKYQRNLELAGRTDDRWFGGVRDWLSDRKHASLVAVVRTRAAAWHAAVKLAGSGGDQPGEEQAPL